MNKTVYIRTDMNQIIATGHMMRCLSIADAVRQLGGDVIFLLADRQAEELLKSREYKYYVLNSNWNCMEEELFSLIQIIQREQIDRLFIDSYQVTYEYLKKLSNFVKITYMDDLFLFDYPVNEIICYANYWREFQYKKEFYDTLYQGTQYVPLKKIFWQKKEKYIKSKIERILICSGGSDRYGVLESLLETLNNEYIWIDVICGIYCESYEKLCERYKGCKNIKILKAVTNIEKYMSEADLAISAGGTTLYELCAIGTPTISYAIADNQLGNVKKFHEDGIIPYTGDVRKQDIIPNLLQYIKQYENPIIRQEKSQQMQQLVDGKGALRIAECLLNPNRKG